MQVTWAEQQVAKIRQKRDYVDGQITQKVHLSNHDILPLPLFPLRNGLESSRKLAKPSPDLNGFNDPMWANQWYLVRLL